MHLHAAGGVLVVDDEVVLDELVVLGGQQVVGVVVEVLELDVDVVDVLVVVA